MVAEQLQDNAERTLASIGQNIRRPCIGRKTSASAGKCLLVLGAGKTAKSVSMRTGDVVSVQGGAVQGRVREDVHGVRVVHAVHGYEIITVNVILEQQRADDIIFQTYACICGELLLG